MENVQRWPQKGSIEKELPHELTSSSALADFRAIYGGIPLGIAVCLSFGLNRAEWLVPAVGLAGVCALEAGLSRAYSWLASGTPSELIIAFMAGELLAAHWAWTCYRALMPGSSASSSTHPSNAAEHFG